MDPENHLLKHLESHLMEKDEINNKESYLAKPLLEEEKALLDDLSQYSKVKRSLQNTPKTEEIVLEEDIQTAEEKTVFGSSLSQKDSLGSQIPFPQDSDPERYQILETLGAGAMGVVHRVQDRLLGREVALKKINCQNSSKANTKKQEALLWRLKQEACILSLLEHPNITPLYEMQLLGSGEIQFTMRKVEGKTLRNILNEKKEQNAPFEENTLYSIFLKVCEAVAYAHSRGIVHRDLKPENIMIGNYGEVYVMDWGIAKILHPQDISSSILKRNSSEKATEEQNPIFDRFSLKTVGSIGTVGYMSPEQCESASQVTPASDVYALGKILRECFLLMSPAEEFQSLLHSQQFKKSQFSQKNYSDNIEKNIPQDIRAISRKATAQESKDRYSCVQDLMDDIKKYQQNLRISVRKYNSFEIVRKWVQRNRIRCLIAISFLGLCLLFWGYFFIEQEIRFQEAYQKGLKGIQEIRSSSETASITILLSALGSMNEALSIRHIPEVERGKLYLAEELIKLACQSKNYKLAEYLGTEIRSLSIIDIAYKNKIQKDIQTKKNETINLHLVRLDYWLQILEKRYVSEQEKEDAIFEISKMSEDEIWKKLLQIIEDHKMSYFLQNNSENQLEEQFYEIVIKALGRLNHPESAPVLLTLLKEMSFSFSTSSPPLHKINCMVLLSSALEQTEVANIASEFLEIRLQMGQNGLFWQRTRQIYQHLVEREGSPKKTGETEEILFKQAILNLDQNKLDEAILGFERLIQISPQSRYYYFCGNALLQKKDFERAIQRYQQALEFNPEDIKALLNRGVAYAALHKREEAMQDYDAVLQKSPQRVEAYSNRGLLYLEMGQLEIALQNFEQAIQYSPLSAECYLNRGFARSKQGDREFAFSDYDQALLLNPYDAKIYIARGLLKQEMKNNAGALFDYSKAICLEPNLPQPYFYRGQIRLKEKKETEAFFDFEQALKQESHFGQALFPLQSAEAYYYLGFIKNKKGDLDAALHYLKKALEYPPLAETYFQMAEIYKEQNQIQEAIA
ncbi:MAG: tetratricopeptide repeat protein, partial [Planctomycetota bacterium]